jgi:hypothetical protein
MDKFQLCYNGMLHTHTECPTDKLKTRIFSYLAYGKRNIGQIRSSDGEGQEEDKEMNTKNRRQVTKCLQSEIFLVHSHKLSTHRNKVTMVTIRTMVTSANKVVIKEQRSPCKVSCYF